MVLGIQSLPPVSCLLFEARYPQSTWYAGCKQHLWLGFHILVLVFSFVAIPRLSWRRNLANNPWLILVFFCWLFMYKRLKFLMVNCKYFTSNHSISCRELQENNLSGVLPDNLGGMMHLQYLNLSHNNFNGSIPPSWGTLSSLKHL